MAGTALPGRIAARLFQRAGAIATARVPAQHEPLDYLADPFLLGRPADEVGPGPHASRGVARVRVNYIDAKQSTAELISGDPAGKYKGKMARYAGRETESPVTANQAKPKFLQFRQNSKVYDGPGRSFREVKELKAGTRVRYLYTVGPWAKATDGRSTFWVPMAIAQIVT